MKRYFNYTLVLTLLLVCFNLTSRAQSVQVVAKLDKVSIPLGEQTVLRLIAHIPAKSDITFPILADSIAGKIQIVNILKPDTSFDKDKPQDETITHNYIITGFDAKTYTIPSYTFRTKTASYTTDSLTFQVVGVPVDTTKSIYDIKQPLAVSYTWWDWLKDHWRLVLLCLAIVLAVGGIIYYLRKQRKTETPVEKAVAALPADAIAINKLNALRDKKLWQQNEVKEYYSELTDVLREYLEKRYQITAHEQTTDEIFASLKRKDLHADGRNKLKQILVLADLVKFAKEKPVPADNELCMDNALGFIVLTKQEFKPDEHKEELPG